MDCFDDDFLFNINAKTMRNDSDELYVSENVLRIFTVLSTLDCCDLDQDSLIHLCAL